ncbi:hypothetical protein V5799_004308 [Amblyomma americanum]|uniref:Uncharacterized protein n=1 Tax=Amblyomma americanum TaxID=6943 RepID=A0AAQ4D6G8_AMBAM
MDEPALPHGYSWSATSRPLRHRCRISSYILHLSFEKNDMDCLRAGDETKQPEINCFARVRAVCVALV